MDVKLLVFIFAIIGAALAVIMARIGYFQCNRTIQFGLVAIFLPLLCKFHRKIYVIIKTLPRDIRLMYRATCISNSVKKDVRYNRTIAKIFRERVTNYPDKPCFLFEDRIWTNLDIYEYSNQIASVFQQAGYCKNDVVALMMSNRPEYVATWLGLSKLGIITALININLRQQSLQHSIKVANVKAIIYLPEFSSAINDIASSIDGVAKYIICDEYRTCKDYSHKLCQRMLKASVQEPVVSEEPGVNDILFYMYTSGTTGLPKAALFFSSRYLLGGISSIYTVNMTSNDILYNCIPLYHASGNILGVYPALAFGVTTVIKRKFSVTAYWKDCVKYKCTLTIYVGEMFRYLLRAPPCPEESNHSLRAIIGNGMGKESWRACVNRFKISRIAEIYGSSEGNANMMNIDNKIGAVGCMLSFLPKSWCPITIIRVTPDTHEPIRGPDGFCIHTDIDEPGMLIGFIDHNKAMRRFHGYIDKDATKKKIIENVFRKGDAAFLTGDILTIDEFNYFYFKDRVGDTFRWKGENVSTAEVENIIGIVAGNRGATVYGVQVPGTEGRAGMVAISDGESLNLKDFFEGIKRSLPQYARPIFLRLTKDLEITSTFKLQKVNLKKDGFDPNKIKDKLYFLLDNKEYVELTPKLYQDIISGIVKL